MEGNDMQTLRSAGRARRIMISIISAAALGVAGCASKTPSAKSASSAGEQQFDSPKAAVDALLGACRANDEAKLAALFGEQVKPFVSTGDPATDQERCQALLAAAGEMTRLDPKGPNALQLVVGSDDWPFPFPIVKDGKSWHFDTFEGMKEVRRRRIGADELEAIKACRTYVIAQEEHRARAGGAYSQDLVGKRGKSALAWPTMDKESVAPLVMSDIAPSGKGPQATWRGYHYRILTSQGSAAPGGARSYLAGGRMTRGYALVAYPVRYGWTGIMTFVVGADGRVHEKNLGENTDQVAATITAYDPDGTWRTVD
jgi:hypothetical protein